VVAEPDKGDEPIERTTVQARQGGRTTLNLRVLMWSTIIAVVVLGALYFVFFPRWFSV
jgi:hypothetical protein